MRRLVALAGLLAAACGPSGGPESREPGGDVILITIDTLRAGHLGLYGYPRDTTPHLDRWFGEGRVLERAYAAEAATSPSVVSMLSGRLPQEHGVRLFFQLVPEEVELIPERLPEAYQTAAFVSNMVLTDEAMGLGSRFDHFDDFVALRESQRVMFERTAEDTTNAALLWLARDRDPERPLFLWVHYIDPHGPYRPPEGWGDAFDHEGTAPLEVDRIPTYGVLEGVDDALEYVDRYDAEIRYADAQVGRLLDGYARTADVDDALVLLTADHGETMANRERWFDHGYHVYEDIVHVPLMLRGPGVAPGRVRGLASGVDVFATLLGAAGVVDRTGPGIDLRRTEPPADRVVFFEASRKAVQWRGALRADDKWVVAVVGEERAISSRRTYDLREDPLELDPRPWRPDELPARLLDELIRDDPDPAGFPLEYAEGVQLSAPKVAPGVSAENLEALRALGYAE